MVKATLRRPTAPAQVTAAPPASQQPARPAAATTVQKAAPQPATAKPVGTAPKVVGATTTAIPKAKAPAAQVQKPVTTAAVALPPSRPTAPLPATPPPAAAGPTVAELQAQIAALQAQQAKAQTPPPVDNAHVAEGCEKFTETVETPVEGVTVETEMTVAAPEPEGVESIVEEQAPVAEAEVVPEQAPTDSAEGGQPSQLPATRPASAVGRPITYIDDEGFDSSDDRYPTLRIVAGSGKLASLFQVGSLILGSTPEESESLCSPPDPKVKKGNPIRFVPIGMKKAFRENLGEEETAEGISPRIFSSREEVEAAGGTTQWLGNQEPSFKPTATTWMLIEKPEGRDELDSMFQLFLDGKHYCPAVYYSSNSAFKAFAQIIHNLKRTLLTVPVIGTDGQPAKDSNGFPQKRRCYPKYFWELCVGTKVVTRRSDNREFTIYPPMPRVLTAEETGAELRAFAEALAPSSAATAAE